MKIKLIQLFVVALLLISTGCINPGKKMATWVGRHVSELYQSWGPPNQVTSDGSGGQILIYGRNVYLGQTPGEITPGYNGSYSYTAPVFRGYQRVRMFYADSEGVIYSWRWQGL